MRVFRFSVLVGATLASAAASAADLPVAMEPVAPAPIVSPALFSWSGPYLGANIGYGWGRDDRVGIGVPSAEARFGNIGTFEPSGWLGGVQGGYNLQLGMFVLGAEGDFQFTGIDDRLPSAVSTKAPTVTASASTDMEWYATMRARLGVIALDHVLLYGTGGVAVGKINYTVPVTAPLTETMKNSGTDWGYVIGAGVEYALTQNVSVKAEYQFLDIRLDRLNSATYVTVPTTQYHTLRFGVNYRFSGL